MGEIKRKPGELALQLPFEEFVLHSNQRQAKSLALFAKRLHNQSTWGGFIRPWRIVNPIVMRVPKRKVRIIHEAVTVLQTEQVIGAETAETIRAHVVPIALDWRRLARYSFIAAIACLVIAVVTVVLDEAIVRLFERMLPTLRRLFHA